MNIKDIPFEEGAVVVTSISGPNAVLKALAQGCLERGGAFIVVGDSKSPRDFKLEGCRFYGLEQQRSLSLSYPKLCHEKSYTRKNIGYLLAIQSGAQFIVETDDDNAPIEGFWGPRNPLVIGDGVSGEGWLNAYRYFSKTNIYPRGFPLEQVLSSNANLPPRNESREAKCLIQQGLANGNPDVDAVYRMLFPLPLNFDQNRPLILGENLWCPFNSQNTTTFPEAYPLLYLPTFCTFRMTDIWRSFIAQRVGWTCDWNISFHSSTVYQDRNEHDLLRDFSDEVPGYLNNAKIAKALASLPLTRGPEAIESNMRMCYQKLIEIELIRPQEMELLEAWFSDLKMIQ